MNKLFHYLLLSMLALTLPLQADVIKAPEFSGTGIDGVEYSLSDYQGKHVVLYFWATWCPACRQDMKAIQKVYTQSVRPKGAELISVSLDRDLERLKKYAADHKIEFPVLFDGKGWQNEIARLYGIHSTPTFILLSPEGEGLFAGHWSGEIREALKRI